MDPLTPNELCVSINEIQQATHFLGWGSKRKSRMKLRWDKRYWIVMNNCLMYFDKNPQVENRTKKTSKFTACGGFRLNEISIDVDDTKNSRSGQNHCCLLYHFDRTYFIKYFILFLFFFLVLSL